MQQGSPKVVAPASAAVVSGVLAPESRRLDTSPSLRGAPRATRQSPAESVRSRRDCFVVLAMTKSFWLQELRVHRGLRPQRPCLGPVPQAEASAQAQGEEGRN